MDNFNYKKQDTYTNEELKEILEQNSNFMTKRLKTENEEKIKEYETKVNQYEEDKLFSSVKNNKQKEVIKSLMNNDNYKTLSKSEAFKKITDDYKDIFKFEEEKKEFINNSDIGKTLLDLHAGVDSSNKLDELEHKAKTKGITDKKELETYITMAKVNALKKIK